MLKRSSLRLSFFRPARLLSASPLSTFWLLRFVLGRFRIRKRRRETGQWRRIDGSAENAAGNGCRPGCKSPAGCFPPLQHRPGPDRRRAVGPRRPTGAGHAARRCPCLPGAAGLFCRLSSAAVPGPGAAPSLGRPFAPRPPRRKKFFLTRAAVRDRLTGNEKCKEQDHGPRNNRSSESHRLVRDGGGPARLSPVSSRPNPLGAVGRAGRPSVIGAPVVGRGERPRAAARQ